MFANEAVLYSGKGKVWKLSDFGLTSKGTSEVAHTTTSSRGTECYRSPELMQDKAEYSAKVDIWALGVILHELVTGTKPWKSDGAVMEYYRSKQQLDIQLNEGFGDHAKSVVCKSIAYMFQRRPSSRPRASEIFNRFSAQYALAVAVENAASEARTTATKDYLAPPSDANNVRHDLDGPSPTINVTSSGLGTTKTSAFDITPERPETGRRLQDLATELQNAKRWQETEIFCEEMEITDTSFPDHSDAIGGRGRLTFRYGTLRQHEEALEMQKGIVRKNRKELGPDDPQTLSAQHDLAIIFAFGGQYEDAAHLYEDTIERRKKVLGPTHRDTLSSEQNLVKLYAKLGQQLSTAQTKNPLDRKRKRSVSALTARKRTRSMSALTD